MTTNDKEYMREYMKKRREKNKEVDKEINKDTENIENNGISTDDNKEVDNENKELIKDSKNEVKENVKKIDVKPKKKGKKINIPMSPEGFADFSVGMESTTLALRKASLSENDKTHIENSAKTLASLYDIPQYFTILDYGLAMTLPHLNLTLDRITAKNEIQIMNELNSLKSQGYDVDTKLFLNMNEKERQDYISKLDKDKKIKNLRNDIGTKKEKPENNEIVTGD